MFYRLFIRLTRRFWNRRFKRIICNAHEVGQINSYTMHLLAGAWDREFYPEQQKRMTMDRDDLPPQPFRRFG